MAASLLQLSGYARLNLSLVQATTPASLTPRVKGPEVCVCYLSPEQVLTTTLEPSMPCTVPW